jgi:hypothetical protein
MSCQDRDGFADRRGFAGADLCDAIRWGIDG